MPVQIHRLAKMLGAAIDCVTADHMQVFVDGRIPEDTDLDYKQANEYVTAKDGAEELAKDVTGMANSQGGLLVIGIEQDAQGCAKSLTPIPVSDTITGQMTQILHSRIVPWLAGIDIRGVTLSNSSEHGFYLIAIASSPLAPHAIRTGGPSKPRYSYALRSGTHTRWLEETEIANAYRNRFRLAEEHTSRAVRLFDENPIPSQRQINADAVWVELALVPAGNADRRLDLTFSRDIVEFLQDQSQATPAPIATSNQPVIARRRVRFDTGIALLDLGTNGSAFIRAPILYRSHIMPGPIPMHVVRLEYQVLAALHLAAAYARWTGAYGDADVLARTNGIPEVYLEEGATNIAAGLKLTRRSTETPAQITVPLDAINDDPSQLHFTARSLAADLLADYGFPTTRLLHPNGTIAHGLIPEHQPRLRSWAVSTGLNRE